MTAQQVEDGTASLRDYALAMRDHLRRFSQGPGSFEQTLYLGCLLRQEGSLYRSSSTYLVQLTPEGRVILHAKDMALSGRKLNPVIYARILAALGVPATVLANLASPDPDTAAAAQAAIIARLRQEPDAPFNVAALPGASGYAAVYFAATRRGIPIVLLAGFELNASHVIQEDIDCGNPDITARDVVNRDTLRAFVIEAQRCLIELYRTDGTIAVPKARVAFRDPSGPWRHGSVYLYVLDTLSNVILIHGAFPDRFELRPLVPTVRDVVTGELVLPQVIEAAKRSPEGGFLRYFWDDPADDTDIADIPKVGYAREFTGSLRRADGAETPFSFIIGSGFYLSAPEVAAARQNDVIETVLPQIMRTMTASTVDAISGRIQQAHSGTPPPAGVSVGGASTLSDALLATGGTLANRTVSLTQLLTGSSFTLPLNGADAEEGGSGPRGGTLTLWGNADYRNLADGNQQTIAYDGDVVSGSFGIDTRLSEALLGGVSVALAQGTVEYTDPESVTGAFTTRLSSINPYVGWRPAGGTSLWATAGYGWGEIALEESANTHASDLRQRMVAAGVSTSLVSSEQLIGGGTTSLRLKGDTAFTQADVDAAGSLQRMTLDASRHRLMVEGLYTRRLASEATLTPSIEIGVRYDGGDGETGAGVEVGAGVGYTAGRLAGKVNARALLEHNEAAEYEEWGFSSLVAYQPRSDGQGLSMTLGSTWGVVQSGVDSLWSRQDVRQLARIGTALTLAQQFQAELRYGLKGPQGRVLWLPYVGTASGNGQRAVRLGVQLTPAANVQAGLELGRRDSIYRTADHAIQLHGSMGW